jgi:hypothetical protein
MTAESRTDGGAVNIPGIFRETYADDETLNPAIPAPILFDYCVCTWIGSDSSTRRQ